MIYLFIAAWCAVGAGIWVVCVRNDGHLDVKMLFMLPVFLACAAIVGIAIALQLLFEEGLLDRFLNYELWRRK